MICQACGYSLVGLPLDGACPECGTPVAASDLDNRPGTPWQQKHSLRAWVRTTFLLINDPKRLYGDMQARGATSRTLTLAAAWGPPMLALESLVALDIYGRAMAGVDRLAASFILLAVAWLALATILMSLAEILFHAPIWRPLSNARRTAVCRHAAMLIPAVTNIPTFTVIITLLAFSGREDIDRDSIVAAGSVVMWICLPAALLIYVASACLGLNHSRPRPPETAP